MAISKEAETSLAVCLVFVREESGGTKHAKIPR